MRKQNVEWNIDHIWQSVIWFELRQASQIEKKIVARSSVAHVYKKLINNYAPIDAKLNLFVGS